MPDYREARGAGHGALRSGACQVFAPVDGIIGNHDLQPGEYLSRSGRHAVGGDRSGLDRSQFQGDRLGADAGGPIGDVRVDSYPGERWKARVASISPSSGAEFSVLPPQNATGNWVKVVQRIPVKLELTEVATSRCCAPA